MSDRRERKAAKKAAKAERKQAKREAKLAAKEGGRHAHLRANPRTRRASYWTIFLMALAIFAASLVDMIYLDNQLYGAVLAAYITLLVVALVLFLSRHKRERAEEYAVEPGAQVGELFLRCTTCSHVFAYDEQVLASHEGWIQHCPNCDLPGPLPHMEGGADEGQGRGTGTPAATA